MWSSRYGESIPVEVKVLWLPGPLEEFDIDLTFVAESVGYSVDE